MPVQPYKRPSGIYYLRGTFEGRKIDRSARTRSRSVAERLAHQIERDILDEISGAHRSNKLFAEAVEAYIDAGGEARFMLPILDSIGLEPLSGLTGAKVHELARSLYPDAAPSTVNRQVITPVRAVLGYAEEQGWIRSVPRIRRRKESEGKVRWLRIWEAARLVRMASARHRPILLMGIESGMRAGEILSLDWKDIDLDAGRIALWGTETKSGRSRIAHFGRRTRAILETMPDRTGPVFKNRHGNAYKFKGSAGSVMQGWCKRLAEQCRIEGFHPHVMRHTWATWAYAVSQDIIRLKAHGGWSSSDLVERYAHLAPPGYGEKIVGAGWEPMGIDYTSR